MNGSRALPAVVRGAGAALAAGLLAGVATRLLMRVAALLGGEGTEFTWGGTVSIVVVHVLPILPGALALAASRGRWPWVVYGLGLAVILFFAASRGGPSIASASDDGARLAGMAVVLVLTAAVYVAMTVVVHGLARPRRERTGAPV